MTNNSCRIPLHVIFGANNPLVGTAISNETPPWAALPEPCNECVLSLCCNRALGNEELNCNYVEVI